MRRSLFNYWGRSPKGLQLPETSDLLSNVFRAATLALAVWLVVLSVVARSPKRGALSSEGLSQQALVPLVVVTIVYGTFGWFAAWTKDGSLLRRRLLEAFGGRVRFERVDWPAFNSFSARRTGAERLIRSIESSRAAWPGAKQVVIAHSHGGNVALSATRHFSAGDQVDAIVCMATPFLVATKFRFPKLPQPIESFIGLNVLGIAYVVLIPLAMRFAPAELNGFFDRVYEEYARPTIGDDLDGPAMMRLGVIAVSLGLAFLTHWWGKRLATHYELLILKALEPTPLNSRQILIMRQPGDEAGAFVNGTYLLSWLAGSVAHWVISIAALVERFRRLSRRTAFGRYWRNPFGVLTACAIAGLIVPASPFLKPNTWFGWALITPLTVVENALLIGLGVVITISAFVLLPVVSVLLAAYPALLLAATASVGPELLFVGLRLRVTAEATPPGEWTVHTVPIDGNTVRERPFAGALLHSALYDDPKAISEICNWTVSRLKLSSE